MAGVIIGVFTANLAVIWSVMLYFSLKQVQGQGVPQDNDYNKGLGVVSC
jgi:hypothetical protein